MVCPFFVMEQIMSRHEVESIDTERYAVIVGWDNLLQTLFGQVWDLSKIDDDEDDQACIFWIGDDPESVTSVEALAQALSAYAVIPAELAAELEQEQAEAEPPTPLQQWVLSRYTHLVMHWGGN